MKPAFTLRRVLQLPPKPGNPRNSEGGFVTLRDGRILFVYTRYYGESWDDHAPAELAARISTDGGRSYLPDERIIVPNEGRNVMSVSLLRLADGRIALVYLRKSGGDACDCRRICVPRPTRARAGAPRPTSSGCPAISWSTTTG